MTTVQIIGVILIAYGIISLLNPGRRVFTPSYVGTLTRAERRRQLIDGTVFSVIAFVVLGAGMVAFSFLHG